MHTLDQEFKKGKAGLTSSTFQSGLKKEICQISGKKL